jgi:PGM1 C-terminal domain/ATP-grasp domain
MQHHSSTTGNISHSSQLQEKEFYKGLQQQFVTQYQAVFHDKLAVKTVIVIPSLTLDQEILAKVKGHFYYEERLLCLLMLLRMPRTQVIYVTSIPVDPSIIDYYLHLLPGITGYHAKERLILLSCFDASAKSLTQKIIDRPRLVQRIKNCIAANSPAHITCFNVTEQERRLSVLLGVPLYGCDPDLNFLGTKSGSRKIFKACCIDLPDGFEDVKNKQEVINCLVTLKQRDKDLEKAVIKLNDGFSGEGNAVFSYDGAPEKEGLQQWIEQTMHKQLKIVAERVNIDQFFDKLVMMHGVVEVFVKGEQVQSPSVQCRINPLGRLDVLSTHDQLLGGESGQVFLGATFPANKEYAAELGAIGIKVSAELKKHGVLGRFGIDFMSVKKGNDWKHYAIEINLRKGGTTHPYLMLQFLTEGDYDADSGNYYMHGDEQRYYFATDNLQDDCYKGLTPHDLIDIAMFNGLHFSNTTQEGIMFHLISTLSQYGKLGLVSIGRSPERAKMFYEKVVEVLNKECKKQIS